MKTLAKIQSIVRAIRGRVRRAAATRSAARIIGTVMKSAMAMKRSAEDDELRRRVRVAGGGRTAAGRS